MSTLSLSSFYLFLLLLPLIFSSISTVEADTTKLIEKTCNKSAESDPNISFHFCFTSLHSAKHSRRATDLRHLGLISLRLIRRNLTHTRRHIHKLLSHKPPIFVKSCLADCFELYSDALPAIKQARRNFKARRYDDANFEISSAMDDSSTCEDGFGEKRGVVSPLTKRNRYAFELSAIALSIINMLDGVH